MESIDLKKVGKRIRSLRKRGEQKKIAERIGMAPSTLSKYEKGHLTPSLEFLIAFIEEKGVSFRWLITGKEHTDLEEVCWIIKEPKIIGYKTSREAATELINNVVKILGSGNKTLIEALEHSIEVILLAMGAEQPMPKKE